jgi:hypothetical protein
MLALLYSNIIEYLENKRKFKELFESLENINIRIKNINKFINRKEVVFEINNNDNDEYNFLDIDENNNPLDEISMDSSEIN